MSFVMEAWMPESIAIIKLRGYAEDSNGQIVQSVPGQIRLQINPGQRSKWSLFGRRNDPLNLELNLRSGAVGRGNNLYIQVVFRPSHISQLQDPVWRVRCSEAFVDLRAYLIGK